VQASKQQASTTVIVRSKALLLLALLGWLSDRDSQTVIRMDEKTHLYRCVVTFVIRDLCCLVKKRQNFSHLTFEIHFWNVYSLHAWWKLADLIFNTTT